MATGRGVSRKMSLIILALLVQSAMSSRYETLGDCQANCTDGSCKDHGFGIYHPFQCLKRGGDSEQTEERESPGANAGNDQQPVQVETPEQHRFQDEAIAEPNDLEPQPTTPKNEVGTPPVKVDTSELSGFVGSKVWEVIKMVAMILILIVGTIIIVFSWKILSYLKKTGVGNSRVVNGSARSMNGHKKEMVNGGNCHYQVVPNVDNYELQPMRHQSARQDDRHDKTALPIVHTQASSGHDSPV